MCLLLVCMVMWRKGSKCTSGKVCFCRFCYWDAVIEILCSIFPPLPTAVAVFFSLKKKSQKRNILYSMHWYCKSNQSRFLLFLSLWLVNSEKEVQFECSDDGEDLYRQIFFPPVKRSHLEIKQLHLALLTYCENCKTLKYNLVNFKPAVAICHPQWIVRPFFQASLHFF